MRPIYYSNPKTISKSLLKFCFLILAVTLISTFASCTADEMEVQPKNEVLKETFLHKGDSIKDIPIPPVTTTTNTEGIDPPIPPINPPTVPPKRP
ncbi:MAG TPA: hypothetical protein VF676_02800 [Flavobacterium sp.]|jgi:hypothetical protein